MLFSLADTNNNQEVSPEEFRNLMTSLPQGQGGGRTEQQIGNLFGKIDSNADETITLEGILST